MDVPAWLSRYLPFLTIAVSSAAIALAGLVLVQLALRRTRLCPADFPLARKLFPAAAVLIVLLAARSDAAHLRLGRDTVADVTLAVGVIWSSVYLVSRMIWITAQLTYQGFTTRQGNNIRSRRVRTQLGFIERLGYLVVAIIGTCATLMLFDGARAFGQSLLASAGVAGIILGLAAQKSLSNLIAGFQIAFTQPLRIEDVVVVEGEWGWVEEINLTYVVIRIWDLRRLVLPITYFVEKPFQNWTRNSAQILGAVTIDVSHQVPFAAVEAELFRLLDASARWDRDQRVLQVVEAKERSVTLRALMTAVDSPTSWDLRCEIRLGLVEFLQREHPEALSVVRVATIADTQDASTDTSAVRTMRVPELSQRPPRT